MEKSEKECNPKIVSYFVECGNFNYEYNCELCDNVDCEHWKEWHNDNELWKNKSYEHWGNGRIFKKIECDNDCMKPWNCDECVDNYKQWLESESEG